MNIDMDLLSRGGTLEPRYLTWVDADGNRHVEIEHIKDCVVWSIKKDQMVKTFDYDEAF